MGKKKTAQAVVGFVAAVFVAGMLNAPAASAVPAGDVGVYPAWQTAGSAGAFTGSATFSPSTGFPGATFTSNSTTLKAPSGESAWLGASTGFGQEFGSSRSQPYLYLSPAAGQTPSTTVLTFDGQPPAGWGLALGDIDADWVQLIPRDAAGAPLAPSTLNPQDTSGTPLLNYCNNAVPKPSTCAGPGPFLDHPWWVGDVPSAVPGSPTVYPPGSVVGNGPDTVGSYDWFKPSAAVRSIDIIFTVNSGFPIYQLWLAAPAPAVTITGSVTIPDAPGAPIPDGTVVQLNSQDGTPVLDIEDKPVVAPVAPDGSFEIESEQRDFYEIAVVPPAGYTAPPPVLVAANVPTVVAPPLVVAPVVTTPTPTPTPTSSASPSASAAVAATALAATGVSSEPWLIAAGVLLLLGIALFVVNLLGRRRERREAESLADAASETPENTGVDDSISRDGS